MPIRFHCQQCGSSGNANSDLAGQIVNCPNCKALMEIPGPAEIFEGPPPPPPVASAAGPQEEGDEEEEPGGFRFTVGMMLQLTTMVAACMMVLMPLARPDTGWAAVAGLFVLLGFAIYHSDKIGGVTVIRRSDPPAPIPATGLTGSDERHREYLRSLTEKELLQMQVEEMKRLADQSSGNKADFPWGSGVLLTVGLTIALTSAAGTIVAELREMGSTSMFASQAATERRWIGFLLTWLGSALLATGVCRIVRWLGRARSS